MSQSNSRPLKLRFVQDNCGAAPPASDHSPTSGAADSAIDAALRSVPLPEGLLTRLGMLAYTMPEDAADHVDWLGC